VVRLGNNFWVQNEEATINSLKNAGFNAYAQNLIQAV
jgi:hypothetical protein